ncbi:ACT domain-containing protein [Planctobacterium marinum]|uniref:ACT domain-containing protein n=1 Tax=Planctobacterium marinum TaxID=1631968 RepID=UPI001E30B0F3|nr:ACT domain-containing protein [Planctobacterium marinum]MCC2605276.1 ACT domain-containing protein [Planctobacterium marinum]
MSAIKELAELLKSMKPVLHPQNWVFCCIAPSQLTTELAESCFAIVKEQEGLTLITQPEHAEQLGFNNAGQYCRIELLVYSSLEAVGLTAAVSNRLTEQGISANVVAAFHHDHIFVPKDKAEQALLALTKLSEEHQ